MSRKVYGFELRDPSESESAYFRQNPHVGGMASEDDRIVLNPFSSLTEPQKQAVAVNEAVRLFLRKSKTTLAFPITDTQRESFAGTPYEADERALRETLIGRILSGDRSAGDVTPEQRDAADTIQRLLDARSGSRKPGYLPGSVLRGERGRDR